LSPSDDHDYGDGYTANVDVDDDEADDDDDDADDDDDDNDESGYLHVAMETRHDLEMNGNRGRRLFTTETDSESGTQLESSNTSSMEPRKVVTRRSWFTPLITSLYPLIQTGIAWR
jgi:hypothetical protein